MSSVEGDHTPAQMTTIQTSDDNHQLIMLTFNESGLSILHTCDRSDKSDQ